MGGTDVPFSVQKSHWCILLTSWGLTSFLNLILRSNFARDQTAQGRRERLVVLALPNNRTWGTCPKITQIKQVYSFLSQKHRLPVLWISFPTVYNTFLIIMLFYFKLQILNESEVEEEFVMHGCGVLVPQSKQLLLRDCLRFWGTIWWSVWPLLILL